MSSLSTTALIVGSGPVGLWLALQLRRAGLDVLVIDSKIFGDGRERYSKALIMSAGTLATFDSRGLAPLFLAEGIPLPKAHFGALETFLELNERVLGVRHSHNLAISQARTELILLDQCEKIGVRFAWGLKFIRFMETPTKVVATAGKVTADKGLSDETVDIEAKWLVGCDGTHSSVRTATDITFDGIPSTVTGILADIQLRNLPPESDSSGYVLRRGPEGVALIVPTGDGIHYRFTGILKDSRNKPASETVTMNEIQETLLKNFGSDLGAHSPGWMSRYGSACRIASSFRAGRVFLAGDAAHQFLPAGGQGMNLGLQDATNLAWKLVIASEEEAQNSNHPKVERILDSYSQERLPIAADVIENVQVQLACFIAEKPHEQAICRLVSEALLMPQLNEIWTRKLVGFGEPTASYRVDGMEQDQLDGTRLAYLHLDSVADESLKHMPIDKFALLLRKDSGNEEDLADLQAVAAKWAKRTTVIATSTSSSDSRWDGVIAVLIRPDMRIAWVGREKTMPTQRKSSLATILQWWFGDGEEHSE